MCSVTTTRAATLASPQIAFLPQTLVLRGQDYLKVDFDLQRPPRLEELR